MFVTRHQYMDVFAPAQCLAVKPVIVRIQLKSCLKPFIYGVNLNICKRVGIRMTVGISVAEVMIDSSCNRHGYNILHRTKA